MNIENLKMFPAAGTHPIMFEDIYINTKKNKI